MQHFDLQFKDKEIGQDYTIRRQTTPSPGFKVQALNYFTPLINNTEIFHELLPKHFHSPIAASCCLAILYETELFKRSSMIWDVVSQFIISFLTSPWKSPFVLPLFFQANLYTKLFHFLFHFQISLGVNFSKLSDWFAGISSFAVSYCF